MRVKFITSQYVTTCTFKMSCQETGCSFIQFNCSQFPVLRYIKCVINAACNVQICEVLYAILNNFRVKGCTVCWGASL